MTHFLMKKKGIPDPYSNKNELKIYGSIFRNQASFNC